MVGTARSSKLSRSKIARRLTGRFWRSLSPRTPPAPQRRSNQLMIILLLRSRKGDFHGAVSALWSHPNCHPHDALGRPVGLYPKLGANDLLLSKVTVQQPSRRRTARFGNAAKPLVILSAVATARCEPPIVGQAVS